MKTPRGADALLAALRHPTRRSILQDMAKFRDPISPCELSERLDEPLSNVSYHVRVLADRKVIELVDTAPRRGSMQHFYRMDIDEPWALAVLGLTETAEDPDDQEQTADD